MPGYHWKGVTKQGLKIEGDLTAASKEAVLDQLRRQKITVSEIVETTAGGVIDTRPRERSAADSGSAAGRAFRNLAIAAMFAAGAVAVGYVAPFTVWTCSREQGVAVTCSISESIAGVIELRSQRLADASSVELETEAVATGDSARRTALMRRIVFLDGKGQSIRSATWDQSRPREWFRRPRIASVNVVFEEFQRFFSDTTQARHSTWGAYWVPLILIAVLLLLALAMAAVSVLSLLIQPEWAQAQVDRLNKQAGRRSA